MAWPAPGERGGAASQTGNYAPLRCLFVTHLSDVRTHRVIDESP